MPVIGLRDLSRKTRDVVERLEHDEEPIIITRHGKPIATLSRVSEDQTAAVALAVVPEFVSDREQAAREIEAGEGEPATDLLAEFEAEDEGAASAGEVIEIPSSLVEQLLATITEGHPEAVAMSPREREHLTGYIEVLARGSILSALERARNVNSHLLAESGAADPAEAKEQEYVAKVRTIAAAELLAQSSVEIK